MNAPLPRMEGHGTADALLAEAQAVLPQVDPETPPDFVVQLFGQTVPEDLAHYSAENLALLASRGYAFLREREPAHAKVRCAVVGAQNSPEHGGTTVLEAINDDMPFLLDSVLGELGERRLTVTLVAHPVLRVARESGQLTGLNAKGARESFIHLHIDGIRDDAECAALVAGIENVLNEVRRAVTDWLPMLARVNAITTELKSNPPLLPVEEIAEAVEFLQWLLADNFTFLGMRDYVFQSETLVPNFDSALGVMRNRDLKVLRRGEQLMDYTPEIMAFLKEPRPLIVAKANVRSRVHRRVYLDYIGIKRFDGLGHLVGEHRIVGLFTSSAYTRPAHTIPFLRRKIGAVAQRAGFDPASHSGKALTNVLEHYPRDELFQLDEDTLYHNAIAILQLGERPRVRVLVRRDRFDRFVSVLVFVPRDRYGSHVRARIGDYLASVFIGRVSAFYPYFPDEGPLIRVHYIIGRSGGPTPHIQQATLEREVSAIVRTWTDGLAEALALNHPAEESQALLARYRDAFSAGYHEAFAPAIGAGDIRTIEALSAVRPLAVDFHHRLEEEQRAVGLKIWSFARPVPLSERVPVLENMGFRVVDERTFHVAPKGSAGAWLHDMLLERADGGAIELHNRKELLEDAFLQVMGGAAENDGYNALTLTSELPWRDIALIRTISRYLRQLRIPYSQDYLWATLVKHAGIAADIVALFHGRFDPTAEASREKKQKEIASVIEAALEKVDSLDEDRMLRLFLNAVQAAIRTNFYRNAENGAPKAQIAIKFESGKLTEMPLPRPLYEIFVYSPRVEGVHLRFGKVARGGIRWSDRPQDFRTEILGLVKAQQVKNAVIVPFGAKGGFVPKQLPKNATREQVQAEGVETYKLFLSALLEMTDNINPDGTIVPPKHVVRHDGDDPYLVVAADKGTASFSDIANGLALEHGYWLGDAFASGGSAGYDHKAMGITARGAWESVKRHFRQMDTNIHEAPFTVAGVGDMSGDVFGNGMLREDTIQLVAAFDHRDIFIDPDPDPKKSFAERKRLFELPRSSWQDYDKSLLSPGGGIYPRIAKEIHLSQEAQQLLHLPGPATPQQIIRAVLQARVDLLFFGGIGTYVRASNESDADVGDRANDAIRVSGADLNAKVIGEGANLGMTQRGRIEAALRGIWLNTDAIDNSAGVNTSDIEVNIKIALSGRVRSGSLLLEDRNKLLAEMTNEVARLVLRNNYQQTLALSLAQRRGMEDFGFQQRLMHVLEQHCELDRSVEFLPDEMALSERRKRNQPLTRPELAVLLAYSKLSLYNELLASDVPDDPYLGRELDRYFPAQMTERFTVALQQHRLRREIIATQLTNSMIDRGGATLIVRIADQTGASAASIAAAFAAVRQSYDMVAINSEIDGLDNKISGDTQLALYATVQDLLLDRIVWFLRNVDLRKGLELNVAHYRDGIAQVEAALDTALSEAARKARHARAAELRKAGVPEALAARIASLTELKAAPDIVLVADRTQKPVSEVAATYFAAQAFFQLDRLAAALPNIAVTDYFDRLALHRALDLIGDAERRLGAAMVANGAVGPEAVEAWARPRQAEVKRIRAAIDEIAASGLTVSKLTVAASLLGDLVK